jgi:hypothetical protein
MKVLSVTSQNPAEIVRVSRQLGFKTEDATAIYPVALIRVEEVMYVHIGGVTIGLPFHEFVRQAAHFNPDDFPAKEATCV